MFKRVAKLEPNDWAYYWVRIDGILNWILLRDLKMQTLLKLLPVDREYHLN